MYHFLSWPSTICSRIALGLRLGRLVGEQLGLLRLEDVGGDAVDVDVQRREPGDLDGEIADEPLELVGAGDEVRLAVDLDQHADPAAGVDVARDEALAGLPAGLLGGGGEALLAQGGDGLLDVAVGVLEGALAVHEAGAGALAQFLDRLGRDCHLVDAPVLGARSGRARFDRSVPAGRRCAGPAVDRTADAAPVGFCRGRGLGEVPRRRPRRAREEVVLVEIRLEGERGAGRQGGDEVGCGGLLVLGLLGRLAARGSGSAEARAARSRAPSIAASATSVQRSRIARIASSLAGMM